MTTSTKPAPTTTTEPRVVRVPITIVYTNGWQQTIHRTPAYAAGLMLAVQNNHRPDIAHIEVDSRLTLRRGPLR